MLVRRTEDFIGGWLVGDFSPAMVSSKNFEFAVKYFRRGDIEPKHFQVVSRELSVVVHGSCSIGGRTLEAGDALLIEPGEVAGFEALTDCAIAVVKWPSVPGDKVLTNE